jgi:hypothetical protein
MSDVDYKQVVCMLISDGLITYADVTERVSKLVGTTEDTKYQTEAYQAARRLIVLLNEKLIANGKKPSAVNITALGSIERLIRIDKKSEAEIADIINWCQADEFWHSVILSTNKLRKHFDTMSAQRARKPRTPATLDPLPPLKLEAEIFHPSWKPFVEDETYVSSPPPFDLKDLKKELRMNR